MLKDMFLLLLFFTQCFKVSQQTLMIWYKNIRLYIYKKSLKDVGLKTADYLEVVYIYLHFIVRKRVVQGGFL